MAGTHRSRKKAAKRTLEERKPNSLGGGLVEFSTTDPLHDPFVHHSTSAGTTSTTSESESMGRTVTATKHQEPPDEDSPRTFGGTGSKVIEFDETPGPDWLWKPPSSMHANDPPPAVDTTTCESSSPEAQEPELELNDTIKEALEPTSIDAPEPEIVKNGTAVEEESAPVKGTVAADVDNKRKGAAGSSKPTNYLLHGQSRKRAKSDGWTDEENDLFFEGILKFGATRERGEPWNQIVKALTTKTEIVVQARLHSFFFVGGEQPALESYCRRHQNRGFGDLELFQALINNTDAPPNTRGNPLRSRSPSIQIKEASDVDESEVFEQVLESTEAMPVETTPEEMTPLLPVPEPFDVLEDPNEYYVEEEAHLYHNPPLPSQVTQGVSPEDLAPMKPPPPPPTPPDTGNCTWTYDTENRLFLADFRGHKGPIDPVDKRFMFEVMERDDLTLISDGLLDIGCLDRKLWNMQNIAGTFLDEFYHKFRRFDSIKRGGKNAVVEVDNLYSMRMFDYCAYLEKREKFLAGTIDDGADFSFQDHTGKQRTLDVSVSSLYCIDLDLKRNLKELYDDFMANFRMTSILPGGQYCLMNKVTDDARPFMGPNLYITPTGTFTHFHQDGHGSVDSGHVSISGFNEICMLRRLTERHKRHAMWLLTGRKGAAGHTFFDGLYSEPHGDGLGVKPRWPTKSQIDECRRMGYCPSLPILKSGQHIHINKGRLHAFRKMTLDTLPPDDCHYEARQSIIQNERVNAERLCVSVAWDWNFIGLTERGIYREVTTNLESTVLNRLRGVRSLAIPEFSVLEAARHFAKPVRPVTLDDFLPASTGNAPEPCHRSVTLSEPERVVICRGILPVLRYVVNEHIAAMETAMVGKKQEKMKVPDTYSDPSKSAIDPRGSDGFSCMTCSKELSNVYYHCNGCEKLLSKDFNICVPCHTAEKFKVTVQMHPNQAKRHATLNHTGNMSLSRNSRCPCKNGPVCRDCHYCLGCSCRCHARFTLHSRLHTKETELQILKRVEEVATIGRTIRQDKYLDDEAFTRERLDAAKRSWGHVDDLNPYV